MLGIALNIITGALVVTMVPLLLIMLVRDSS